MEVTKDLTAYAEAMARIATLPQALVNGLRNGAFAWRDHTLYTAKKIGPDKRADLSVSSDTKVVGLCNFDRRRLEANHYFMVTGLRLLQGESANVEECAFAPLTGKQLNGELDIKLGSVDVLQGLSLRKFANTDPRDPGYYRLDAPFMIVAQTEIIPTINLAVPGTAELCIRLEFDGVIIRKK